MGHHIDAEGRFRSDKHPELPPDRIRLNLANPRSEGALRVLADAYAEHDPELAADLRARLDALHGPPGSGELSVGQFHITGGWLAQRKRGGVVKISPPAGRPLVLDRWAWASVVAHVSDKGETGETCRAALDFHGESDVNPVAI